MGLLSLSDVQPGPLTAEQALARAEVLVAQAICPGLPGLGVHTWEAQVRLGTEARPYGSPLYGRRRLGPSLLRYWPITGLLSVTQDGLDVTPNTTFDAFSIRKDTLAPEFTALGVITVTFQTGWTQGTIPPAIREAVALTLASLQDAPPEGVESERIGDHAIKYRAPEPGSTGLSPAVLALLRPYRAEGV